MTRISATYGRTTEIHAVVIIRDVCRDIVVRQWLDETEPDGVRVDVVDPAYHEPVMGYDPMAPHYTQHALNTLRKVADADAYADHRFSLLVAKAFALNKNRGRKFLKPRNLFEIAAHMMTVGGPSEHNTPDKIQAMVSKLARRFGIAVEAAQ